MVIDEKNLALDVAVEANSVDGHSAAELRPPSGPPEDEDQEWPGPWAVAGVMASVCLSIFLVALDRTIISTAIPQITDDFLSLQDVGWYGSAFLLTSCALLLPIGKIMSFYSPKWVFLIILAIFELGSVICGAATSSNMFIVGRAIAGVGGAGTMTGGTVLLTYTIPLAKRPKFQGMIGASFGIASILGPLLGGAFTSNVTWRWCFYINLPIGAISLVLIAFMLQPTKAARRGTTLRKQIAQLDPLGSLFLMPALICLLLALQWGGVEYSWSSGRVIACLVVFAVLWTGFTLVQFFNKKNATIPHAVMKNRDILSGQLFMFCHGSALTTLIIYMPLYFQAIRGESAVRSGINTFPAIIALVVGIIGGGVLTGKVGYYAIIAYACTIISPIGCGLIAMWDRNTSTGFWVGSQILAGFGLGLGFQAPMNAAQTVLPQHLVTMGVAVIQFAQVLGAAVFVSVAQNLLVNQLASGLAPVIEDFNAGLVAGAGATQLRTIFGADKLEIVLDVYMNALRHIFLLVAGLAAATALGSAGFRWNSTKDPNAPGNITLAQYERENGVSSDDASKDSSEKV